MQVLMLEDQIGLKSNGLEIEDMWDELSLCYEMFYERMKIRDESDSDDGKERALFGSSQLKDHCNSWRGKYGHKATNCCSGGSVNQKKRSFGGDKSGVSSSKTGGKVNFTGNCHYCKKYGHRVTHCARRRAMEIFMKIAYCHCWYLKGVTLTMMII
jgi:hypothetical protein